LELELVVTTNYFTNETYKRCGFKYGLAGNSLLRNYYNLPYATNISYAIVFITLNANLSHKKKVLSFVLLC
jgi:hypothetical protein